MVEIVPTAAELAGKKLGDVHFNRALAALRTDGYVVLNNVVNHAHLDLLSQRMAEDLLKILAGAKVPHNFVWGNVQQDPPPFAPYVFADIVANPWVVQLNRALLGEGFFNSGYSGNTNVPGSGLQPVHVDNGHLWPQQARAHPAAMVVVNIPLDTVDEEGGSIELWPGTHLDTTKVLGEPIAVDPGLVERRRQQVPPLRCNSPKGSILLRDMRLWHRGTPNRAARPRFMLAMVHKCRWLQRQPKNFARDCAAAFTAGPLDHNVEFVDGPIEYLFGNHPYDYTGKN